MTVCKAVHWTLNEPRLPSWVVKKVNGDNIAWAWRCRAFHFEKTLKLRVIKDVEQFEFMYMRANKRWRVGRVNRLILKAFRSFLKLNYTRERQELFQILFNDHVALIFHSFIRSQYSSKNNFHWDFLCRALQSIEKVLSIFCWKRRNKIL